MPRAWERRWPRGLRDHTAKLPCGRHSQRAAHDPRVVGAQVGGQIGGLVVAGVNEDQLDLRRQGGEEAGDIVAFIARWNDHGQIGETQFRNCYTVRQRAAGALSLK